MSEFTVFLAEDAASAFEIYSQNEIDLVVSDLMMPKGGGDVLYAQLESLGKGHTERIVFVTGGVFEVSMQRFLDRVRPPLLAKPLNQEKLLQMIHEQLSLLPKAGADRPFAATTVPAFSADP